jgi:uncharacterized repeat protein (TIGR04052 family)
MVGSQPFSCSQSFMLGTPASAVSMTDFRLFVYDVALLRADGQKVKVALTSDGRYQGEDVALLDFEDHSGTCIGTKATHTKVVGNVPNDGAQYTGVHFRIGLPAELNHLDEAKQPAPLNLESMFWSWKDGHILIKFGAQTPINFSWEFLLADSLYDSDAGCTGSDSAGYSCPTSFQPIVELPSFDVSKDTVKLDLATLLQNVDFARADFTPLTELPSADPAANALLDYQPGCHSDEWDAECTPIFAALGIDYPKRSEPDPSKQSFASKL